MNLNREAYQMKYQEGYGITIPEGYFIRCYKQILEYECKVTGGAVLDFGMGNGTHLKWLLGQPQNWDVYGCDIAELAVSAARKLLRDVDPKHFVCIERQDNIKEIFKIKFDLILANQVLYYMDQLELQSVIDDFYQLLNPGGIIFVSMMSDENYYFSRSKPINGTSLRRVRLTGRLNEDTDINFKNTSQLVDDFRAFKRIQVGYYDTSIREDEGSTKHIFFVGSKPNA